MIGGLLSRVDTSRTMNDQMLFILSNSTIEVLSHGVYGFACKVTMKPGKDSGFIDEDENPVTTFVIKLVPLDMRMAHRSDRQWSSQSTIEKLKDEVSLQSHVYKESLRKHAYSPCPALIHYLDNYTVGQLDKLLPGEFFYRVGKTEVHDETLKLGVIFMEFSSSPQGTLYDAVKRGYTTLAEKQGEATRLYCMALECGVNHRDAHENNFLIDNKGQLKLIDFGLAKQLTKKKRKVLLLIPQTVSYDCDYLRVKLKDLYKKNAWFLRKPFSIDSYRTKVAKKAVKRCASGLCEERPAKMLETEAAEEIESSEETQAAEETEEPVWSSDLGTTEQDRVWARELEEIKMKEISRIVDDLMESHYYHKLKDKTPEEIEEFRINMISRIRRNREEEEQEEQEEQEEEEEEDEEEDEEEEEEEEEEDPSLSSAQIRALGIRSQDERGGRRTRKTKQPRRKTKQTRRKMKRTRRRR